MKETFKLVLGGALAYAPTSIQTAVKETVELMFWKKHLKNSRGLAYNGHYEKVFTDVFGLPKSYFNGKRMLDIGCGPLGSLEWASNATERVGVDPLADKYLELTHAAHKMRYIKATAEDLPFDSDHFDVVSMFNALDHVEDAMEALGEAVRVVKPRGDLLVIVEVNHKPTLTEPQTLTKQFLNDIQACSITMLETFAINERHDVYESIFDRSPPAGPNDPAIICARIVKDRPTIDWATPTAESAVLDQKVGTGLASDGTDTTS